MITIRHIKYFQAVAEALHFHGAAEKLNVSQPALSHQIKQLEEELGCFLFLREKKKVSLTPAGHSFLSDTYIILNSIDEAVVRAQLTAQGQNGILRLGFVSSAANGLLRGLLKDYAENYTAVGLDIKQMTNQNIIDDLANDTLDIGICRFPLRLPAALQASVLWEDGYVLAVDADIEKNIYVDQPLQIFSTVPLIIFPRYIAPDLYDDILYIIKEAGYSPPIACHVEEQSSILELVGAGVGAALVPASMVNSRSKNVKFFELPHLRKRTSLHLVVRFSQKELIANFIENAVKTAKKNF